MKNYDELTNDLLERRDRYVADQKKKRKKVMGVAASLCCFCLVALLGFGMWQGGMFDAKPPITLDDSINIGDKDYINPDELDNSQTTTPGNNYGQNNSQTDTTQNDDPIRIAWTINKVENQVSAAMRNFSTDKYYSEKKTLADITAYLGRDLSKLEAVMPQGFEFFGRYETDFFYELDGDVAYDSCAFGYKKDEQQITIRVSKISLPYDCLYVLNNPTVSNINGVEVTIGGIYKADNSGEFELIFADFSHGGLQYRVTIDNVPSDDYKCLNNIVSELTK
ncbi:MAG: hypothetical protein E7672_09175 [Ruminococcaceae bacterium]|nr:hypothetical protein [Oscillospiraceae bacterium]